MEPLQSIGKILTGDERRDAVHIAIAPIEAAVAIKAGDHVSVTDGKASPCEPAVESVGIADPYLLRTIKPGERFWLFLHPYSVTSIRHEWTHPSLPDQAPMSASRVVAERVAAMCGKTYEALMDDSRQFSDSTKNSTWPDYIMDNSERYKDVSAEDWVLFWQHFTEITGEVVKEHDSAPYSCSC